MNAWTVTKWALLVIAALGLAVGLARVFSGPEDAWVRDAQGNWVEHGHPAGPPPASDYRPPWTERVLPWVILGLAVAGLVGGALVSRRRPASREELSRDVRFWGTLSIATFVVGMLTLLGLVALVVAGTVLRLDRLSDLGMAIGVAALISLLGFLSLAGLQALGIKKLLEAHYDLKRATGLLQDTLERRRAGDA